MCHAADADPDTAVEPAKRCKPLQACVGRDLDVQPADLPRERNSAVPVSAHCETESTCDGCHCCDGCHAMTLPPSSGDRRAQLLYVEDAVSAQMDARDPKRTLDASDFYHVLTDVSETVLRVMGEGGRIAFNAEDRAFIKWRVGSLMSPGPGASEAFVLTASALHPVASAPLMSASSGVNSVSSGVVTASAPHPGPQDSKVAKPMQLQRFDRVACRVGSEHKWLSGAVHLHASESSAGHDAENLGQQTVLPYVDVMLDPPDSRRVVVREEHCHLQRAASHALVQ